MPVTPLNRQQFADEIDASDDLMRRFDIYADLLCRWQEKINLVGRATLADLWRRHFLDSAQIFAHIPKNTSSIVDIGSGAGFPGLVLAILASAYEGPIVGLVESDTRKSAFLREVNRETSANAKIYNRRVEDLPDLAADVVTARGCAPLERLLPWVVHAGRPGCMALLSKGQKWRDELTLAEKNWTMSVVEISSQTDTSGIILKLEGLTYIE